MNCAVNEARSINVNDVYVIMHLFPVI